MNKVIDERHYSASLDFPMLDYPNSTGFLILTGISLFPVAMLDNYYGRASYFFSFFSFSRYEYVIANQRYITL
jgi:hypothetical protein